MATSPKSLPSAPERIFNTLPVGFFSWLEFYDSIPEWHRVRDEIQFVTPVLKEDFLKAYSREPQSAADRFLVSYEMKKDFLLARCAEQLLAARLPRVQIYQMQSWLLGELEVFPKYLEPLFETAISIAKKSIDSK